jgi:phosphate:Na+ symporter
MILLLVGFLSSENFELIAVGVAILIFGISLLETGFRNSAEGRLKNVLKSVGGSFPKSFGLGFGSTVVFQSSSLITVVAITFLSAGLLSLKAGMGIVFGSNLGTTATSWLVALFGLKLKLSSLAAPFIVFGVLLYFQKKKKTLVAIGHILLGLGFFFTGIFVMQEGFNDMTGAFSLDGVSSSGFVRSFLFFGIGIVLTLILQSSSASMAIVLTAIYEGQIQYEDGLVLAIGANVGTTITAIIGSAAANAAGKQVAMGHLIFNIITAIVAIVFLPFFVKAVDTTAVGIGIKADDYTLKLSLFHTLFNLAGIIIMVPLVNKLCDLLNRLIPPEKVIKAKARFINKSILEFPNAAFLAIIEEEKALFADSKDILLSGIGLNKSQLTDVKHIKETVDKNRVIYEVDIDSEYALWIKPIYSKILKYASVLDHPVFAEEVRYVSRKMVSCLKDMNDFHKNIREKSTSTKDIVRHEYNRFRFLIASVIYEINQVVDEESLNQNIERLQALRLEAKENEARVGESIHDWVVEKKIGGKQVSSLLNDAHFSYNICRNLIQATERLYTDLKFEDPEELEEEEEKQIELNEVDTED